MGTFKMALMWTMKIMVVIVLLFWAFTSWLHYMAPNAYVEYEVKRSLEATELQLQQQELATRLKWIAEQEMKK